MYNEFMRKEAQEAIDAGERALRGLHAAEEKLKSAGNWGIFDMLGGGFFSSYVKQSKIREAKILLEQAKEELTEFPRELKDVGGTLDLQVEIGDFLTFADFFFDGFVADYLVQNKISDAREDIEIGIFHVKEILNDLYRRVEV